MEVCVCHHAIDEGSLVGKHLREINVESNFLAGQEEKLERRLLG